MPNRISCRILPGSSSVAGVTLVPCRLASVRIVPSASDGSSGSTIHEVISESRPKMVMNHGAPAAMTARSACSGSKIRSDPRSSVLAAKTVARRGSDARTSGVWLRHSASRCSGPGGPGRPSRAGRSPSGCGCAALNSIRSLPFSEGMIWSDVLQDPCAGTTACQVSWLADTSSSASESRAPVILAPRSAVPTCRFSLMESSSTSTVMPSTLAGSACTRPSFTSNTSAKSPPTPIRTLTGSGSVLMLRSVISSLMPSLTTRRRATSIVLSASPGNGGIRLRNVQANGSRACGGSGSGTCPLMLSSSLLINRVSRTNRPCEPPGRTSPEVSQIQNVVPSSSVTRPLGAPIVVAGAPSNVQA